MAVIEYMGIQTHTMTVSVWRMQVDAIADEWLVYSIVHHIKMHMLIESCKGILSNKASKANLIQRQFYLKSGKHPVTYSQIASQFFFQEEFLIDWNQF